MLQLLVEVPDADGRGRQLITSASGTGPDVAELLPGRNGLEGPDYIAVTCPTTQRLGNQTVRDDHERLMLIGVDVSRLSTEERTVVRDALTDLRPEIHHAVGLIDWTKHGPGSIVPTFMLSSLLERPVFARLPTLSKSQESRDPPWRSREPGTADDDTQTRFSRLKWLLGGVAGVLAATFTTWVVLRGGSTPPPPQPSPSPDLMAVVTSELNCSSDDLRRWIINAKGLPDDKSAAGAIQDVIGRLAETKDTNRYFLLDPTPPNSSQLPDFVASLVSSPTVAQVQAIRTGLREAHRHLAELRAAAAEAGRCPDWKSTLRAETRIRKPTPAEEIEFLDALVHFGTHPLATIAPEPEPLGPFFGQNDHRRFRDLAGFFTPERSSAIGKVTRINYRSQKQSEALREVIDTVPPTDQELQRLTLCGEAAAGGTRCEYLKRVVEHFQNVCLALAEIASESPSL